MKPTRILLLLIALVAGGLAAFLATRGSGPAQVSDAGPAQVQPAAQILVAKQNIGVGQKLDASSVEWQPWPDSAVRPEYITIGKSPDAAQKIVGTLARFEIFPGEPIQDAKLVHSDQGFLSAVLLPGMRGVSIPVNAASGSGGFIIPNDRVDVVVTESAAGQTTSHILLNDVKVLAIGTRLGQTGTTGAPADPTDPKSQIFTADSIATLELTPGQAETLINATVQGKISLVLRSVADFAQTGPKTTTAATTAAAPSPPPESDDQTVRVIRFGRQASVTPGTANSAPQQPVVDPAAYIAPVVVQAPVATPSGPTVMSGTGTLVPVPTPAPAAAAAAPTPAAGTTTTTIVTTATPAPAVAPVAPKPATPIE